MNGVSRVSEGSCGTITMFVEEVTALPAYVNIARAGRFAAGALDLGSMLNLVKV